MKHHLLINNFQNWMKVWCTYMNFTMMISGLWDGGVSTRAIKIDDENFYTLDMFLIIVVG